MVHFVSWVLRNGYSAPCYNATVPDVGVVKLDEGNKLKLRGYNRASLMSITLLSN